MGRCRGWNKFKLAEPALAYGMPMLRRLCSKTVSGNRVGPVARRRAQPRLGLEQTGGRMPLTMLRTVLPALRAVADKAPVIAKSNANVLSIIGRSDHRFY
jgi:hypothetical protein